MASVGIEVRLQHTFKYINNEACVQFDKGEDARTQKHIIVTHTHALEGGPGNKAEAKENMYLYSSVPRLMTQSVFQ